MNLIYLSPVQCESFSQRSHKFVEWFRDRTGGEVLWVDPYPTRLPSWQDFRRVFLSVKNRQTYCLPPWLHLLRPGGIPVEPLCLSVVNRLVWKRSVRQIRYFSKQSDTLLVIGKPSELAIILLESIDCDQSLYDVMDDFPAFYSGISSASLARRESLIVRKVDRLWVSSSHLKARWDECHDDVRLVRNGFDPSAMQEGIPRLRSQKKVFGYVGTLASWFDWEWINVLAESRPDDEIRLIGPLMMLPPRQLPDHVRLLPACDHASAMRAMTQFDVGLIPFKKNALTESVDPIKYYEYRASGLPVISVDFGEMSLRRDENGVFISQSLGDISVLAKAALEFCESEQSLLAFASMNTWKARFDSSELFNDLAVSDV